MRAFAICLFVTMVGCRGAAPQRAQEQDIAQLVDSLRPAVERATGLTFRGPTNSAMRSREELREFLLQKLRQEFPPDRQEGVEAVYRLLGMVPDTLDLKAFLLELFSEQVAGFYDPETSTLYGMRGAEPAALRFVLAHELVHALQHQYLPVDSIMRRQDDADRQTAAHAVLEGHATLASLAAMLPDRSALRQPGFWELAREQVRAGTASMAVFSRAPLVFREGMIFPYLSGAEFMRWWDSARTDRPLPTVAELPQSSEQILHPDRYARGDTPVPVRFAEDAEAPLFEDTLGELEIQVLATILRGGGEVLTGSAIGWGGDRFRAYRTPGGPALVWYTVWDNEVDAARFLGGPGARLGARSRPNYRTSVTRVAAAPRPTVRVVIAPVAWGRWGRIPALSPLQASP
jgi:hypothetical protein